MVNDDIENLFDGVTRAGRGIEDAGRRAFGHRAVYDGEEVLHIEEVTHRLRAKTGLASLQSRVECWDGTDGKAWPCYVCEPQGDERQAGHCEIILARLFRDAVACEGARWRLHTHRHMFWTPVA